MLNFDTKSLVDLRNKVFIACGNSWQTAAAVDAIAEHFNLPSHLQECNCCSGVGRIPYGEGSLACPRCGGYGKIKVFEWTLP